VKKAAENRIYVYIAIGVLLGLTVLWFVLDGIKKKNRKKLAASTAKEEIVPEKEVILPSTEQDSSDNK